MQLTNIITNNYFILGISIILTITGMNDFKITDFQSFLFVGIEFLIKFVAIFFVYKIVSTLIIKALS